MAYVHPDGYLPVQGLRGQYLTNIHCAHFARVVANHIEEENVLWSMTILVYARALCPLGTLPT